MRPVLVLGPPRSGSTWVSQVLAANPGTHLLHEPDSDPNMPFGLLAKAGLGRYPLLRAGDVADRYAALWTKALTPGSARRSSPPAVTRSILWRTSLDLRNEILFADSTRRARIFERSLAAFARPVGPPATDHVIVKSVHCGLATRFVLEHADPIVVLVRRNPLNGVASWLDLDWRHQRLGKSAEQERQVGEMVGAPPPPDDSAIERLHAWSYTALTRAMDLEAERSASWIVVQHEDLCRDPMAAFTELFVRVGLPWGDAVERTLTERNDHATGYTTKRVASDEPERWRTRLDRGQEAIIRETAERLSIAC